MLKSFSSTTNAIGALNYKGTWNASTNSPTLASGVGTKGDYYVVSVAGGTTLDGISNWGVGDLATYNGSIWQRVEGGADLNGVNLSVSGTSTLSGLTASTALSLNASKEVVSVTNTGTGANVLSTSPILITPTLGDASGSSLNLSALLNTQSLNVALTGDNQEISTSKSFVLLSGNGAARVGCFLQAGTVSGQVLRIRGATWAVTVINNPSGVQNAYFNGSAASVTFGNAASQLAAIDMVFDSSYGANGSWFEIGRSTF